MINREDGDRRNRQRDDVRETGMMRVRKTVRTGGTALGTQRRRGVAAQASAALALVFAVSASGLGCAADNEAQGESATHEVPRNVRILKVERSDLKEFLDISGILRPVRGTDISTEESGVVESFPHEKGDLVSAGATVVLLDRDLLKAQMESAEAAKTLRQFNYDKTKELYDNNNVSGQEMLLVHTQNEQAKAEAEMARIRYERAAIASPFDGIVADRFVELGELVQAGMPVARVVDPYTLELVGSMTEVDVRFIERGSTVRVVVAGLERPLRGTVHWVGFEADPKTGKFPVEIRVDNPDLLVRPGVLGWARIDKATHENVVAIPRDAVVQRPGEQVVFVEREGRALERPVRLGADQGLLVVALAGVDAGDHLIVRGQRDLTDAALVAVQEVSESRDGTIPSDPVETRDVNREAEPEARESQESLP